MNILRRITNLCTERGDVPLYMAMRQVSPGLKRQQTFATLLASSGRRIGSEGVTVCSLRQPVCVDSWVVRDGVALPAAMCHGGPGLQSLQPFASLLASADRSAVSDGVLVGYEGRGHLHR